MPTHFPIASQYDFELHGLRGQQTRGLQQQQLTLLLTQATDANQTRHGRHRHRRHIVKAPLQAAMHHFYFCPVRMIHPAKQLAAAIRTDGRDKRRAPYFLAQMNELRFVELFRTVHGKTVRWPAERVGQHYHLGGVSAEMRMHMPGAERLQPGQQATGFEQVNQVIRPGAISTPAHA